MAIDNDIKDAIKEKRLLIGTRGVLRAVRNGKVESVIYAKNAPRGTVEDISHYSGISGFTAQEYPGNSLQLGELCGKPFSILLIAIKK